MNQDQITSSIMTSDLQVFFFWCLALLNGCLIVYLQDSEEGDYDPDGDQPASGDDDDESGDEEDGEAGPSSSKRPRLQEPQQQDDEDSSDSD